MPLSISPPSRKGSLSSAAGSVSGSVNGSVNGSVAGSVRGSIGGSGQGLGIGSGIRRDGAKISASEKMRAEAVYAAVGAKIETLDRRTEQMKRDVLEAERYVLHNNVLQKIS
jgi:hypothetical protein